MTPSLSPVAFSVKEVVMTPQVPSHTNSKLPVIRNLQRLTSRSGSEKEEAPDISSGEHELEQTQSCATSRLHQLSSSECSEDDTMEIQVWRGERFLRESFMQSQVRLPIIACIIV